jgi:hypothetical protein
LRSRDHAKQGGAMSEFEPPAMHADPAQHVRICRSDKTPAPIMPGPAIGAPVCFDRRELATILNLYGRMVACGEWRDYAIDFLRERAVFSIFRRTTEVPLYRIEKAPSQARRQGAYSVITATGLILKRGHDLASVIGVLDKSLKLVELDGRRPRGIGPA